MVTSFLILRTILAGLGWAFVHGPLPPMEPGILYVASGQNLALESRQDPVPLLRKSRSPPPPPSPTPAPAATADQQADDNAARRAAKAAAELDGYKGVVVVGRAANGAWRAKAYRGATEVLLTVDGAGRVTMD